MEGVAGVGRGGVVGVLLRPRAGHRHRGELGKVKVRVSELPGGANWQGLPGDAAKRVKGGGGFLLMTGTRSVNN